jgi:hypothetical protein
MRCCGGSVGPPPGHFFNLDGLRCDFRPILTVQLCRKMILSCYVRHVEVLQLAELF